MTLTRRTLAAAALFVVAAALLAPVASPATQTTTVTVSAKEFSFKLSTKTAKAGKVTFKVTNVGTIGHDFQIAGKKTPLIQKGKSATLTVTLKKGSYPYLCTVPGHAAAGMKGTFKVT
jgi:uncharacterized cupredoxin-like copper-binding protein